MQMARCKSFLPLRKEALELKGCNFGASSKKVRRITDSCRHRMGAHTARIDTSESQLYLEARDIQPEKYTALAISPRDPVEVQKPETAPTDPYHVQ